MGSGVSESHKRRRIKFRLRHSGMSSAVRELPLRSSPEWVCLRLDCLSSSVSVFARLHLRLSPSSSVPVVVPGGWSRGCRLSVRCSTSRVWKPPWRACFKFVLYSVKCGELVVKRSLLCCDVFPLLTSKRFGRVFPHMKFSHLYWGFHNSVVTLNGLRQG